MLEWLQFSLDTAGTINVGTLPCLYRLHYLFRLSPRETYHPGAT